MPRKKRPHLVELHAPLSDAGRAVLPFIATDPAECGRHCLAVVETDYSRVPLPSPRSILEATSQLIANPNALKASRRHVLGFIPAKFGLLLGFCPMSDGVVWERLVYIHYKHCIIEFEGGNMGHRSHIVDNSGRAAARRIHPDAINTINPRLLQLQLDDEGNLVPWLNLTLEVSGAAAPQGAS